MAYQRQLREMNLQQFWIAIPGISVSSFFETFRSFKRMIVARRGEEACLK